MSLLADRLRQPSHFGAMEAPSAVGAVGNPACGDVLTLYLRIRDDRVVAASFESIGSRYQLATASVLCESVEGLPLDEARDCSPEELLAQLPDLPARNRYLAYLAVDALHRAMQRYRSGSPSETGSRLRELAPDEAQSFVTTLLKARSMATLEVEAMAEAEGFRLPGGAARCLSQMKREGRIVSQMSDDRRSWRWRLAASA